MPGQTISSLQALFQSRLATLEHLLKTAQAHFGEGERFLEQRIAADMYPLATQVAFTCNQPRNFALWCEGKPADNLDREVTLGQAYDHIANTKALLEGVQAEDSKLSELTRIDLGPNLSLEMSGDDYVNEFLLPNFYFHLVTSYNILRMAGVPLGKKDYMLNLGPFIRQG